MSTRTIHMSMSVRGVLSWPESEFRNALNWITKNDGTKFATTAELRNCFFDELAKGHEVVPMASDCEGFDYVHGCPGHPVPDDAEARDDR